MAEMVRLQFGNPAHIDLVQRASFIYNEYERLAKSIRRVSPRVWDRPKSCPCCDGALRRGELVVKIGRKTYHERCLVNRLVGLRRDLRTLGYRLS